MTFCPTLHYGSKEAKMIAQTLYMETDLSYHLTAEKINEEQALIQAAQANTKNFEPLYKKYFPVIVRFVYQRVNDKNDAYDITSVVFYDALRNLNKYKNKGVPFSAWLYRIAINKINEAYRKSKSQRVIAIDNEGLGLLKNEVEETTSSTVDEKLFAVLEKLETEDMEFIQMRFFEARPFKEICDITGLGDSACKMKIYRILEKLKNELKNIY